MNLIRNMEKVSICNKKGSNCRISLENGIMNSIEGDSRGEHKHHRKSFPRPSVSG